MSVRTFLTRAGCVIAVATPASCTTSGRSNDAGTPPPPVEAAVDAPPPAAFDAGGERDSDAPDPIVGEWERRTEPYKGMRVAIRGRPPAHAVVTVPPPVTPERVAAHARSVPAAAAKNQLECQRSLWKPGEELVTELRPAADGGFDATILVRDWGFTGTCRHADSRAPARLLVSPAGELTVRVTRGKTATQHWVRVGP